jgi:hypothetical protein
MVDKVPKKKLKKKIKKKKNLKKNHFPPHSQKEGMLLEALTKYVIDVHGEDNSMRTTSLFSIEEEDGEGNVRTGMVQVKWWLRKESEGTLIIKVIQLLPYGKEPKNVVHKVATRLLQDPVLKGYGLKAIVLESVDDGIVPSFTKQGWVYNADASSLTLK